MKSKGIVLDKYKNRRKVNKDLDEHYFDNIDSVEKAYMLGFIAADGNINKPKNINSSYRLTIEILEKDREILDRFNIGNNILHCEKKSSVYMCIYSNNICKNLNNYGITERKSLTLKFYNGLSNDLISHYIRGYFDGDGCIYVSKNKYNRVIIAGTFEFLNEIANNINVPVHINSINNIFELRISEQEHVKLFYDYLYKDNDGFYLHRKHDKFIV